jgi:predicted glycosyltransferase
VAGSVLLYVQHLLGIGHLQRSLRLARGRVNQGMEVTLVSGGEPIGAENGEAFERIVQLTPIRAGDPTFKNLVGQGNRPVDQDLRDVRRRALLDAFASARPDAVVIEAFPFGRRAFRFELDPLIQEARTCRPRPLIICSVRDVVIVPDDPRRHREIIDRIREDFDCVLVHGDPAFIPLEVSFPAATQIADRLAYTGYIVGPDQTDPVDEPVGAGEVLVSVGGGAVGDTLLSTALEARRGGCLATADWRLLTGPNLPEQAFARLARNLPERVILERYRRDFTQMLRRCRVSVSQAGYNTVLDVIAARARAVVVPFASERETEQQLRAERLAASGVVELVPENELSPERLALTIDRAANREPPKMAIDTSGVHRAAHLIADMIRDRTSVGEIWCC